MQATRRLIMLAMAVVATLAASKGDVERFSSPPACRAHADTADFAVESAIQILTFNDSAGTVEHGLPFAPETASLVTTEVTCTAIVAAFNAQLSGADTIRRVSSGYVVSVDTGAAYVLFVPWGSPERLGEIAVFKPNFAFAFSQVFVK